MTYEAWRITYQSSEQAARAAYAECAWLRAKIAEMEQQEPVGWQRLYKDGSGSEDFTDLPGVFERQRPLYALPGAQPAPIVPREAIEKMLTQLMDIAVSNGANSVSMPDECVEVAAWLCGIPAQNGPSTHEVTDAMALAFHFALTDGSIGEHEVEEIKAGLRAALAAAPEAKP